MNNFKAVACDLDGTLLNNNSEISKENLCAIDELSKKGVHFVPSTGRTLAELPAELKDNQAIRYVIYSNGAAVLDRLTGECRLTCLSNEITQKIFDILYRYETHITLRHNGNCYVDSNFTNEHFFDYYNICKEHRNVVLNYAIYSNDFKNLCYKADNIEVLSAFFHNNSDKLECKKIIEQLGVHVVEVNGYSLEIMNSCSGKGNALHSLADMIGISCEDIISMGDSSNDSSSIITAGMGLAMSNACEALKAVADKTICSNQEHAVAYVLSHFF